MMKRKKTCSNPNHPDREATIYCSRCENYFCAECETGIHNAFFADHTPYVTHDIAVPDPFTGRCKKHNDYPLDHFCKAHFCLCCAACLLDGGGHHECNSSVIPFAAVDIDGVRRHLSEVTADLEQKLHEARCTSAVEGKQAAYEKGVVAAADKVKQAFDSIRRALDAREAELLGQLEGLSNTSTIAIATAATAVETSEAEAALEQAREVERDWDPSKAKAMVQKVCEITDTARRLSAQMQPIAELMVHETAVDVLFKDTQMAQMAESYGEVKCSSSVYKPFVHIEKVGSEEVALSWNAPLQTEDTVYVVRGRKETAGNTIVVYNGPHPKCVVGGLEPCTNYMFWVSTMLGGAFECRSDAVAVMTAVKADGSTKDWAWKQCPQYVSESYRYMAYSEGTRTATKTADNGFCTIIGSVPIQLRKITSWDIKMLKERNNNGNGIYVGVVPSDVIQTGCDNYDRYGWYFECFCSTLFSGQPHNYRGKEYGPRKGKGGQYVHTGDSIGVVMDTIKSELSFIVGGANLGVAYEAIPLDKPLVPCVLLWFRGDTVELVV